MPGKQEIGFGLCEREAERSEPRGSAFPRGGDAPAILRILCIIHNGGFPKEEREPV